VNAQVNGDVLLDIRSVGALTFEVLARRDGLGRCRSIECEYGPLLVKKSPSNHPETVFLGYGDFGEVAPEVAETDVVQTR
jgi:hypothetical protein